MIKRILFLRGIVLFLVVLSPTIISSQNLIEELIHNIQSGGFSYKDLNRISENNSIAFVDALEGRVSQFDRKQRLTSYQFVNGLLSDSCMTPIKERFISYIVLNGFNDSDVGNRQAVIDMIYFYNPSDFTSSQLNFLSSKVISKDEPHLSIIKLAGWLKIGQLEDFVLQQLQNITNNKSKWTYHLFLGRMGYPNSVQYCVETVRRIGMNDNVIYLLIPDLVYLHQKEAVDFILTKILDDEKLCASPNPDYEAPITCAYRLIELVAPIIEGFPVKTGPSGDLEVDDYVNALEKVRQWIVEHYDNYELTNLR